VLDLIRRYLQAGIMEGGLVSQPTMGTPQGGPLMLRTQYGTVADSSNDHVDISAKNTCDSEK
jgi:hypothetical protein